MNGTLNLFSADGYTKMLENMLLNNPDITGNKKCVVSRVKKGS
jgi:hypothetical protein